MTYHHRRRQHIDRARGVDGQVLDESLGHVSGHGVFPNALALALGRLIFARDDGDEEVGHDDLRDQQHDEEQNRPDSCVHPIIGRKVKGAGQSRLNRCR